MGIVVPHGHARIQPHLGNGLHPAFVDAARVAQPDFARDVVGDDGRLVVARTARFADWQVHRIADDVDISQPVDLHGFVIGRQPALVVLRLGYA
ncbi:hypothetical protein G6F22_021073 [Rhizopus arrhizus]|nr:hypothetical protein G6F22_021073 [Rhizopus arrhizus]